MTVLGRLGGVALRILKHFKHTTSDAPFHLPPRASLFTNGFILDDTHTNTQTHTKNAQRRTHTHTHAHAHPHS